VSASSWAARILRNGSKGTELVVENETPVLRQNDVFAARRRAHPCERIYLTIQLMYLDDSAPGLYAEAYRELTDEVLAAAPSCTGLVHAIDEQVLAGRMSKRSAPPGALIEHERN
jgi:flagellar protein FlbT